MFNNLLSSFNKFNSPWYGLRCYSIYQLKGSSTNFQSTDHKSDIECSINHCGIVWYLIYNPLLSFSLTEWMNFKSGICKWRVRWDKHSSLPLYCIRCFTRLRIVICITAFIIWQLAVIATAAAALAVAAGRLLPICLNVPVCVKAISDLLLSMSEPPRKLPSIICVAVQNSFNGSICIVGGFLYSYRAHFFCHSFSERRTHVWFSTWVLVYGLAPGHYIAMYIAMTQSYYICSTGFCTLTWESMGKKSK